MEVIMNKIYGSEVFIIVVIIFLAVPDIASAVLPGTLAEASSEGNLSVGAARVNITPPSDAALPMSGYGGRDDGHTGIHDSLYYRVIVVDDGVTQGAIIVEESIGITDQWWEEISRRIESETGIPRDNVLLAGTHTHAAPTPIHRLDDPSENMVAYSRDLSEKVVQAVQLAKSSLSPARMGVGRGHANININRVARTPQGGHWIGFNQDGPSDKTVHVVKFERLNGEPIAILINYGVHAVVGQSRNFLISADLAGAISRYVEEYYDNEVVVPWTSGTAGDQNPIERAPNENLRDSGRIPPLTTQGMIVGDEAIRVAENMDRMTRWADIRGLQKVVSVPGKERNEFDPTGNYTFTEADPLEIRISLLMINNLALTGVSGEVLTRIGLRLKEESPFNETIMITHCNGGSGYLPDDKAYENPGYEIITTRAMSGAEDAIVNGFLELMERR